MPSRERRPGRVPARRSSSAPAPLQVSICQLKAVMSLIPIPPLVEVPPTISTRPSARTAWPAQNRSAAASGTWVVVAGLRVEHVLLAAGREVALEEEDVAVRQERRVDRDSGQRDQRPPLPDLFDAASSAVGDRHRRGARGRGDCRPPSRARAAIACAAVGDGFRVPADACMGPSCPRPRAGSHREELDTGDPARVRGRRREARSCRTRSTPPAGAVSETVGGVVSPAGVVTLSGSDGADTLPPASKALTV